jgi:formylglycine-generating enzyme required for sulfatase activity
VKRFAPLVLAWLAAPAAGGGAERPGRVERVAHVATDEVFVPAGRFTMGFAAADDVEAWSAARTACIAEIGDLGAEWCLTDKPLFGAAVPRREVYLTGFAIDRAEVTVAAYRRCVAAGACAVAPLVTGDQRYTEAAWPVVNVTWRDATDYCAWAGRRLPTEAEWERAARGTDGRTWPWGDVARDDDFNHGAMEDGAVLATRRVSSPNVSFDEGRDVVADPSDGAAYLAPPGSEPWGVSPTGAIDMAGNAAEWVADYFDPSYLGLEAVDPVRLSRKGGLGARVVRGGSWLGLPYQARTYARDARLPDQRSPQVGFRCARDLVR